MRVTAARALAGVLILGLSTVACGGSTASATPAGGGGGSSASPGASQASTDPGVASTPAPAGGGGGTGNGSIPKLSNGQWTAGAAHADVSGDVTAAFDGTINAGLALTDNDNTTLIYFSADGTQQIAVALAGGTAAVSITTAQFVGGGGSTEGAQCSVSFSKTDDKSIEGTITCTRAPVLVIGGTQGKLVDINVRFSATR